MNGWIMKKNNYKITPLLVPYIVGLSICPSMIFIAIDKSLGALTFVISIILFLKDGSFKKFREQVNFTTLTYWIVIIFGALVASAHQYLFCERKALVAMLIVGVLYQIVLLYLSFKYIKKQNIMDRQNKTE